MSRLCIGCGGPLVRSPGTRLRDFLLRKCCSRACSARLSRHPDHVKARVILNPGVRDPSQELLRLLVIYGLKNDGLPGMAANDFLRLADEMGVAA